MPLRNPFGSSPRRPVFRRPGAVGVLLGALLCGPVVAVRAGESPAPASPARTLEIPLNKGAGRGELILVPVELENGRPVPCIVDTGSPITLFDRSLEGALGRRRGTESLRTFGQKRKIHAYPAPRLVLRGTPLVTGSQVYTADFGRLPLEAERAGPSPVRGVLGMDCLRHYRIHLDFPAGMMRWTAGGAPDTATNGQPFRLAFGPSVAGKDEFILPYCATESLIGGPGAGLLIDTGCSLDAFVPGAALRRAVGAGEEPTLAASRGGSPDGNLKAFFAECRWQGWRYTNLVVQEMPAGGPSLVGLRFLARHRVTLDFPNGTMVLSQVNTGPMPGDVLEDSVRNSLGGVLAFLETPGEVGQRPRVAGANRDPFYCAYHSSGDFRRYTAVFRRIGESGLRSYSVTRTSNRDPWRLERVWGAPD